MLDVTQLMLVDFSLHLRWQIAQGWHIRMSWLGILERSAADYGVEWLDAINMTYHTTTQ